MQLIVTYPQMNEIAGYHATSVWVELHGHAYKNKEARANSHTTIYTCPMDGCPAKLHARAGGEIVEVGIHIHSVQTWIVERNNLYQALRRRSMDENIPLHVIYTQESISCTNMPESLFDGAIAKRHFGKFGRVVKIFLRPKKQMCVVDYENHVAAQRALLNAGAYDGYMFDVTWTKRKKKRVKKEDDPDWVPDTDVEEELSAMKGVPTYRPPRQQPMQQEALPTPAPVRRSLGSGGRPAVGKPRASKDHTSGIATPPRVAQEDPPPLVSMATTLSTAEAAEELRQLRQRVSRTPEEQRRTLDARDRVLRAWGGTGARVKVGGATIGTCPDMCPEKERLQRQAEHQVMTLEASPGADGSMAAHLAVKQYSRSSADQEMPMCYELRPPRVLTMTMAYLLHEVADTTHQVSLADWFHFMWDRCRGIRKDITQQALCCVESVRLVEQCARFHAHCAARLADLEHTQFDQRLNTDNLTKCLQTLKHMYADLGREHKPCEAEFRGYVALLNLGDANFWWEIKQLPQDIQKSPAIVFAVRIFTALDNNNYVRFFRLIRDKATYLQACILLRYFNDVRARGLARIVKAFAPRGGSRYPAEDLMENLAFEDLDSLKSFVAHYGLRISRHDVEVSVILDRNQFIEDGDPYPISRALDLIESKRNGSVGEVIAGGFLPDKSFNNHIPHTSFNINGMLKVTSLLAEDQGYSTSYESNKNVNSLRNELERTASSDIIVNLAVGKTTEPKAHLFAKIESKLAPKQNPFLKSGSEKSQIVPKYLFTPAIPIASSEVVKSLPEKPFDKDAKTAFSFSKPEETKTSNLWGTTKPGTVFQTKAQEAVFKNVESSKALFGRSQTDSSPLAGLDPFRNSENTGSFFGAKELPRSVFGQASNSPKKITGANTFSNSEEHKEPAQAQSKSLFPFAAESKELFTKPGENSLNLFAKAANSTNIFAKADKEVDSMASVKSIFSAPKEITKDSPASIFGQVTVPKAVSVLGQTPMQSLFGQNSTAPIPTVNLFAPADPIKPDAKSVFGGSKNSSNLFIKPTELNTPESSPTSLFKTAMAQNQDLAKTSFGTPFFGSNKIVDAAFGPLIQPDLSASQPSDDEQLKERQRQEELIKQEDLKRLQEEEERKLERARVLEEQTRLEKQRQDEERRRHEQQRKLEEENRKLEELRQKMEEEKRLAELRRLAEEKRKAEEERKIAEERKRLLEQIDKESNELANELIVEINYEAVQELVSEELEEMRLLVECATSVRNELTDEITQEFCYNETKAEKFLTKKLMVKYGRLWIIYTARNIRRRNMLQETPVWLSDRSPLQEANLLRRKVFPATIAHMKAFHRGYVFTGESLTEPILEPYNIMEIVRSSLLKGLRNVQIQYNECFFWKITISSPGQGKWLNKRLDLHNWLLKKFSDKEFHCDDEDVVYLKKNSWNHLMQFAISTRIVETAPLGVVNDSNGIIMYSNENDRDLFDRITCALKNKRVKHIVPLAVITPNIDNVDIEKTLSHLGNNNIISNYKIFHVTDEDTLKSVDNVTKSALRWLARNVPDVPPLQIDSLHSILLRCVGTEFWYRLKLERHTRLGSIFKDFNRLIELYNIVLQKLALVITDESICSYQSFPSELKQFLGNNSPYPKSYEFFPNDWVNIGNLKAIKNIVDGLSLREPDMLFYPQDYIELQQQIHEFCDGTDWFERPKEVAYKIISNLPHELANLQLSSQEFVQYFEQYDYLDIINTVVVEKINCTIEIRDKFVIFDKNTLATYRTYHWWYELEMVSAIKHKALEYKDDDLDYSLEASFSQNAKRMKLNESDEILALEEKDQTMLENSIKLSDAAIARYDELNSTMNDLEKRLARQAMKAANVEEMLRAALNDG